VYVQNFHFATPQARAHAVASGVDYGGVTTTGEKIDTLRTGDSGSFCYHPRLMTKRNRFCSCNSETNQKWSSEIYTYKTVIYIYIIFYARGRESETFHKGKGDDTKRTHEDFLRWAPPPTPKPISHTHIFKWSKCWSLHRLTKSNQKIIIPL